MATPDPNIEQGDDIPVRFFSIMDKIEKATQKEDFDIILYITKRNQYIEKHSKEIKKIDKNIDIQKKELEKAKKNKNAGMQIFISQRIRILKTERIEKDNEIKEFDIIAKNFIKPIENSTSPQEVDIYIAHIEDEEMALFDNVEESKNPVALEKLLRFLKEKEKEAKEKKVQAATFSASSSSDTAAPENLVKKIKGSNFSPLKELAAWIPDSFEDWAHKNVTLEEIQEAIQQCEKAIKVTTDKALVNLQPVEQEIFKEKIKAMHALIEYAETSKRNFNRKLFVSNTLQINAAIFSVLAALSGAVSSVAKFFSFVPGLSIVSDGLRKAFETVNYSSLSVAYALDPTAPKADKLAAFRHYEALKKYSIAESTLGAVGTLTLASGFLLPIIPAAAAAVAALPILAPALLLVGTTVVAVSNIIATVNSYLQMQHMQKIFKEHPLIRGLDDVKTKEILKNLKNKDANQLTTEEKKLLRADLEVERHRAKFWSNVANVAASVFLTLAAAAVFAAALAFPPIAIALTVATVIFSVVSIVKMHQEKVCAKTTFKVNKDLENDQLTQALNLFKKKVEPKEAVELEQAKKMKHFQKTKLRHGKTVSHRFSTPTPTSSSLVGTEKPSVTHKESQDPALQDASVMVNHPPEKNKPSLKPEL
jgi:hypothetical protein